MSFARCFAVVCFSATNRKKDGAVSKNEFFRDGEPKANIMRGEAELKLPDGRIVIGKIKPLSLYDF
jgi:hypothetical protein